jgi:hypothetical protein
MRQRPESAHLARSCWCWRMSLRRTHNSRSPQATTFWVRLLARRSFSERRRGGQTREALAEREAARAKPVPQRPNRQRFGRLVALRYVGSLYWEFRCDCGALTLIRSNHVKMGATRSCGCLMTERRHDRALPFSTRFDRLMKRATPEDRAWALSQLRLDEIANRPRSPGTDRRR